MRRLVPLVLAGLLATGCSEAQNAVSGAADCAALASAIAGTGLSGLPTRAEAEQAVQRLDEQVQGLDDPEVRDAAGDLRDHLRQLQEAVRSADPVAVQQATQRARGAAEDTARACGIPVEQLLG